MTFMDTGNLMWDTSPYLHTLVGYDFVTALWKYFELQSDSIQLFLFHLISNFNVNCLGRVLVLMNCFL